MRRRSARSASTHKPSLSTAAPPTIDPPPTIQGLFSLGAGADRPPSPLTLWVGGIVGITPNPDVDGVSIAMSWHDLEPTQGNYTFVNAHMNLNDELDKCEAAGKMVILGVATGGPGEANGGKKPDWLITAIGPSNLFHYLEGATEVAVPKFWDSTLIAAKIALFQWLGTQFAGRSCVRVVQFNVANIRTEDWRVPTSNTPDGLGGTEQTRWQALGYTHALMLSAGLDTITAINAAFPTQTFFIPFGPISNATLEPGGVYDLSQDLIDAARPITGTDRLLVGYNQLTAVLGPSAIQTPNPPFAGQHLTYVAGDPTWAMNGHVNPLGLTEGEIIKLCFDRSSAIPKQQFVQVYEKDIKFLQDDPEDPIHYGHQLLNGLPYP